MTKQLPPMQPVLACLITEDGPRPTCLGCSERLRGLGMLRVVMEKPLDHMLNKPVVDGVTGEFSLVYYAIADDYTMAECRAAIKERHVGAPWGS